jgi:putative transposase
MGTIIRRAYKTELDPNREQRRMLARCCGAVRWVYNRALARRRELYETEGATARPRTLNRELTLWKQEESWLYEVPNCALQEAFRDLDAAFQHFLRRVKQGGEKPGYPRFRARGRDPGRFTLRGSIAVEHGHIKLPWVRGHTLGRMRLKERGYLPQGRFVNHVAGVPSDQQVRAQFVNGVRVLSATVSERAGRWFVSLQVEQEAETATPKGAPLGVDLGIGQLAVCSDGTAFDNPKALSKLERKLRRLQKEFGRRHAPIHRQPGEADEHYRRRREQWSKSRNLKRPGEPLSANAKRTADKVARLHYRIACVRRNAAHQATHRIVQHREPSQLVIEDLNVAGMLQNRRLSKALSDAGMREVRRQLEYKADWNGTEVIHADRWFPSTKHCPRCGSVKAAMSLSERLYRCEHCGFEVGRDLGAALSLLSLAAKPADSLNACGEGGSQGSPGEAGSGL